MCRKVHNITKNNIHISSLRDVGCDENLISTDYFVSNGTPNSLVIKDFIEYIFCHVLNLCILKTGANNAKAEIKKRLEEVTKTLKISELQFCFFTAIYNYLHTISGRPKNRKNHSIVNLKKSCIFADF